VLDEHELSGPPKNPKKPKGRAWLARRAALDALADEAAPWVERARAELEDCELNYNPDDARMLIQRQGCTSHTVLPRKLCSSLLAHMFLGTLPGWGSDEGGIGGALALTDMVRLLLLLLLLLVVLLMLLLLLTFCVSLSTYCRTCSSPPPRRRSSASCAACYRTGRPWPRGPSAA